MKWISKDKKTGINLELITYWHYKTVADILKINAEATAKSAGSGYKYQTFDSSQNIITMYIGSPNPLEYFGADADEIYSLLNTMFDWKKTEQLNG